jgi:nucleoside-diphosphate-sugar epimerase
MSPTTSSAVPPKKGSRVLVVGASGYLGRSVVRALSSSGYEVRGLIRDPAKADLVREDGGAPVVGDILDPRTLRSASANCLGMVHLAANPPAKSDLARVRVEGTRNLVEVARQEGVHRLVIGSGYWVYRGQSGLIDEDSPVEPRGESQINYNAERAGVVANSKGRLEVVVVRPGMVYGNGSWFRGLAESVRSGEYRVIGGGRNRWSFIDRWDAGTAFATILELGKPGEVYNLVDGHPAPLREFVDHVAAELAVPPPPPIAMEAAEREMGVAVAHHLASDRATSNAKLVGLGWRPRVASYQDGIHSLLREMFP